MGVSTGHLCFNVRPASSGRAKGQESNNLYTLILFGCYSYVMVNNIQQLYILAVYFPFISDNTRQIG